MQFQKLLLVNLTKAVSQMQLKKKLEASEIVFAELSSTVPFSNSSKHGPDLVITG